MSVEHCVVQTMWSSGAMSSQELGVGQTLQLYKSAHSDRVESQNSDSKRLFFSVGLQLWLPVH